MSIGVAKIIFCGCVCLQNYENVKFVTNSPKRCETVIDTKELGIPATSSYYNVFKNGDGYDFVFRKSMYWHRGCTSLYNNKRKRIHDILQNMYYINHNFCVVRSQCGAKYYGIGGEHSVDHINRCERNNLTIDNEPMIRHANATIVSPDVYSKYHHNGMYLMESPDMMHWRYVQKLPVISGIHPGQTDRYFGYSKLDSKISCFYSNILQRYVLFVRANMGQGRRWIQTTRSKDLIHWEPFQLLKMEGVDFDKDNYYHFDVMEYPDAGLFIALSPYTDRPRYPNEICIKLLFSKDGIDWVDSGSILKTPMSADGMRNSTHTTSVFFDRGNYYDLFFNENYNGLLDSRRAATVVRYRIPKDRLVGVKTKSAEIGRLEFTMRVRSDSMILNYNCHDDGYIKCTINGEKEFMLYGNTLNKKVAIGKDCIGQDVHIKVEMKKAVLYSCAS